MVLTNYSKCAQQLNNPPPLQERVRAEADAEVARLGAELTELQMAQKVVERDVYQKNGTISNVKATGESRVRSSGVHFYFYFYF